MSDKLSDKKIAILATDGFEQSELFEPLKALQKAGAQTEIVSLKNGEIKAWKDKDWGESIKVDKLITDADIADYAGLVIPGGVINPDKLRVEEKVVSFVKEFLESGKPIAAICHGPQVLIETDLLRGRKLTSYSSIKTDLLNAGADWVDEEVVVDNGLVTSRSPDDLKAFCKKMIEEFEEGRHYSYQKAESVSMEGYTAIF